MNKLLQLQGKHIATKENKDIRIWRMHLCDIEVECSLGVWEHEINKPQPILINIIFDAIYPRPEDNVDLSQVVRYDHMIERIVSHVQSKHTYLVETLAEELADLCLEDERIQSVTVKLVKRDIHPSSAHVDIEITRHR